MVKLQQRWESPPNVFGDKTQDYAIVDRVALYRLMMTHISAVLRMPRGNRVTRSGGLAKIVDTSKKVVVIPDVAQEVFAAVIEAKGWQNKTKTETDKASKVPCYTSYADPEIDDPATWKYPGSTAMAVLLTTPDDVLSNIRLEETTTAISRRARGPSRVVGAGPDSLIVAVVPPVNITHVEWRDAVSVYKQELTIVFQVATVNALSQQVNLPPSLRTRHASPTRAQSCST